MIVCVFYVIIYYKYLIEVVDVNVYEFLLIRIKKKNINFKK